MRCPYCGVDNDRVMDSRKVDDGAALRRRRVCNACQARFTTYERVEEVPIRVVKTDGSLVEFDRAKIRAGISKACRKLDVDTEAMDRMVSRIERRLLERSEKEIPSQEIGEQVMAELKAVNEVAYVRFASVYRKFTDVDEFVSTARELKVHAPDPGGEPQA